MDKALSLCVSAAFENGGGSAHFPRRFFEPPGVEMPINDVPARFPDQCQGKRAGGERVARALSPRKRCFSVPNMKAGWNKTGRPGRCHGRRCNIPPAEYNGVMAGASKTPTSSQIGIETSAKRSKTT
jgi:hypothetical protein